MMLKILLVGIGGGAGSLVRYAFALHFLHASQRFPFGTLSANLAGCFIIGVLAQIASEINLLTPEARVLFVTGFCGGFTTLSSFIFETSEYLKTAQYGAAAGYVAATLFGAALMFAAGSLLAHVVIAQAGLKGN